MSLHVSTEIGQSGKREREKRHFPERRGTYIEERRGRRYLNHGSGDEPDWKSGVKRILPQYSDFGLDWDSRLRYIPPPRYGTVEDKEEVRLPTLRHFPQKFKESEAEWSTYPEGYHIGKRCRFPVRNKPAHLASLRTTNEVTHSMLFGKNKKLITVWDRRGDFPLEALGDKSYQAPEYSPDFHKSGSTRPLVNFGGNLKHKPDTFVPLQPLPIKPCESYNTKENTRRWVAEVNQVKELDDWKPAEILVPLLLGKMVVKQYQGYER